MATDPVCGMFVEESPDTLHATVRGTTYYFCSESCLNEFTKPEVELRSIKRNIVLSLVLGIPILTLSYVPVALPLPLGWLLLLLATPVQFIAGARFYRGTWNAIKMRSSNMDVLIAIGTSAAYFYSLSYVLFPKQFPNGGLYFDSSAIIIALILVGRLLEFNVRGKATDAIRKLVELQPRTATVIRDGVEKEIPIEQVVEGDIFIVKPGERIATDGQVIGGGSSVDEKMITGESIPVEKEMGNTVIGGTINGRGSLKVRATKVGADTTLSKIVNVVQGALTSKGPVERLVDTISKYFVPIVVSVAVLSFVLWVFVANKPESFGFTTAVAVLIIACPCALGLATPAAISVGAGKGAENGILIKGGEYLERTEKIDTVVFDKTGTLTRGEPSVTDIVNLSLESFTVDEILKLAAVAENRSEHPLASAIMKKAREKFPNQSLDEASNFESIPGKGVRATYSGREILFGNAKILGSKQLTPAVATKLDELRSQGKTTMVLLVNDSVVGLIAAADTIKEHSKEAISALQKMKLEVIMLTGDNKQTAAAISQQLGITRFIADVLPEEKYEVIKKLQNEEHRKVAMVGDGINDAPALAQADVGIAIGSGSDIAIETGGLILMKDDLRDVVAGIQLSRKTMSKIKQNLFWAFVYNVGLIPVAAGLLYIVTGILLSPIFSGFAMAMSSVTVVTNSLTLRRFKPTTVTDSFYSSET
ncbi:MAG TPA: heavy metal translocating P-type ATPase [Nitrososphaerales archaeon]|nr:heavy metal translocating P-type ATPase [Nitrososphaerales archaeon]